MRLSGTKATAIHQYRGLGNQLWDLAGNRPSLDLRFAESKSLVDATTGTNLIDFTRASSGTYVGSDGLIKTATTNLLLRSEEFDDAEWSKAGIGSVTSNAIIAPNGTVTADLITEEASSGLHHIWQTNNYTSGRTYTWSVFVKNASGSRNFQIILSTSSFPGNPQISFNASTGQIISSTDVNAKAQAFPGSWHRISFSATADATGVDSAFFRLLDGTNSSYTGDGTSGIYLWGAQLEQSSTVGEYVKTTSTINSAPRFDHDPETGESLGLLVEESRTNLLLQSGTLSNVAPWGVLGIAPATNTVDTLAPNGENTATKFTEDASGTNQAAVFQSMSWTSGIAYTFTVFAKKGSENFIQLVFGAAAFGTSGFANFDLDAGVVGTKGSATSSSIQAIGNGWYRCIATATASSSATSNAGINIVDSASATRVANASLDSGTLYLWGAQLEEGSFPTSYIPTEGSTVTRAADVASITGTNFSSWYRQDEGTVFAEATPREFVGTNGVVSIDDGSGLERIQIRAGQNRGALNFIVVDNGAIQVNSGTSNSGTLNKLNKYAAAYRINSFASCLDGGALTSGAGTVPTVTQLQIGIAEALLDSHYNAPIKRITYWPQRLPNETLQTITQ